MKTHNTFIHRYQPLLVSLLGIILLALYSWVDYQWVKTHVKNNLQKDLQVLENSAHKSLLAWIKERTLQTELQAKSPTLAKLTQALLLTNHDNALKNAPLQLQLKTYLQPVLNKYGYLGFSIITKQSQISLASSYIATIGKPSQLATNKDFFTGIASGQTSINYAQYFDTVVDDKPVMLVAAPIIVDTQQIATLVFIINPELGFSNLFMQGGIDDSTESYAFDKQGRFLSKSRFEAQLRKTGLLGFSNSSILTIKRRSSKNELSEKSGIDLEGYRNYRDLRVVGTWLWDKSLNLGIATEMDVSKAYEALYYARHRILFLFFISSLLLILIIFIINKIPRQTNREQKTLLEQYKAAIDNSSEGIITLDDNGIVTSFNIAAENIFYYQASEIIGQNVSTLLPENEASDQSSYIQNLILNGSLAINKIRNIQGRRSDGQLFAIELNIVPMIIDKQHKFVGIFKDINETKNADHLLQQTKETTEITSPSKSDFLAIMSHEVRTPLHGILGMVDLLQDTSLSGEQQEYTDSIFQSGKTLLILINDILDFSKIEAGELKLVEEAFDIESCVKHPINLFEPTAKKKSVNINFISDCPKYFLGDNQRIQQIFVNLLANAVKFTETGFINIRLIKQKEDNEGITFKAMVQDSGIGIAKDKQAQLFTEFTQIDYSTTRKFGGKGLGLAICKKLIHLMGGDIYVKSTLGEGAEFGFTLTLPLAKDKEIETLQRIEHQQHINNMPQFKGHVLLVEDIITNQKVAQSMFKKLGLTVDLANDGIEAITQWQKETYDLIFMDCLMPNMDGFDATLEIRKLERDKQHIPIVALTASILDKDKQRCMAAGMDAVIEKPFSKPELFQTLAVYLEQRQDNDLDDEEASPYTTVSENNEQIANTLATIDFEIFNEMKEMLADNFDKLLDCFFEEVELMLQQVEGRYEAADYQEVARIAHSIKSSSANLGALKLSSVSKQLEEQLDNEQLEGCDILINAIKAEFECAKKEMEMKP